MTNLLLSLTVILLGTGYPRPDANHAGPATAVVAGEKWFLVDAGRGTTMRIAGTSLKYENLRGVCITHLHSDHTAGLPDVFITSWQFGRKTTPLELYGPSEIKQLSDAMLQFFAYDIHMRRDLIEKHPAAGATIRTHVVREGVIYDDGDLRVTAFDVDHAPVKPAFGYRFDSGGHSIVISGDTRPNANLIRFAKNADILVQEAYLPEHFDKVDNPEVAAKLKAYHTTAEEAGEIATAAGVKTLVLTHLIPAGSNATFAERAAKTFHGTIIVGDDLKTVTP
jgi:ribonuclease Z